MALPAGGNRPPISLADINAEFGYGLNLAAYRGKLFGRPDNTAGLFSAGVIEIDDFYYTQKVSDGGPAYVGTGWSTVPPYRTITFAVIGGTGGQNGSPGYYSGGPSNALQTPAGGGGAGGATYFDGIIGSAGGAGGGGGSTWQTVTLTNPLLGGNGPASGSGVYSVIGGAGGGGSGGPIYGWVVQGGNFGYYQLAGYAASGAGGSAGAAYLQWTGET